MITRAVLDSPGRQTYIIDRARRDYGGVPIRVAVAILRQAEKPLLRLKTLDDLVAGFKPAVRAVRPKLVLIDVLRVSNRVPLLASPASPKSARSKYISEI